MIDLKQSIIESLTGQNASGCVKTPNDLTRYTRIIDQVRPAVIVETGTFSGKSALWFRRQADALVVTVDTHPQVDDATRADWRDLGDIVDFVGSSTDPDIVERIHHAVLSRPGPVMVVLDSDHSDRHVYGEMVVYGPLVSSGSYMVVEDTLVRWMPWERRECGGPYDGSPADAVDRWLARYSQDWERDEEIEDAFPTTQFPGGWLRRR